MGTSQSHLTVIRAPEQNTTILTCQLIGIPCSEQANRLLFGTLVIIAPPWAANGLSAEAAKRKVKGASGAGWEI
jgi:hypothetical protein